MFLNKEQRLIYVKHVCVQLGVVKSNVLFYESISRHQFYVLINFYTFLLTQLKHVGQKWLHGVLVRCHIKTHVRALPQGFLCLKGETGCHIAQGFVEEVSYWCRGRLLKNILNCHSKPRYSKTSLKLEKVWQCYNISQV